MEKAFALPEVGHCICHFLSNKEFKTSVVVSKAWFEYFMPWLWWSFTLPYNAPDHIKEALHKYGSFIRNLRVNDSQTVHTKDIFSNCTQVRSLYISCSGGHGPISHNEQVAYLVQRNQMTLETIFHLSAPYLLKETLLSVFDSPNLRRLNICGFKMDREVAEHFLRTCTRLKALTLQGAHIQESVQLNHSTDFSEMEYLSLGYFGDSKNGNLQGDIISRCQNLTTLVLPYDSDGALLELIIPACRRISTLRVCFRMAMEVIVRVVDSLPPMKCLHIDGVDEKPQQLQYFSSLRRHYATLHHVHLAFSPGFYEIESDQLLTILSSCPNLRSFEANEISGLAIAEGSPWVCLGLEYFRARIKLDPDHAEFLETRSIVYIQLSRLHQLRVLDLRRSNRWENGTDLSLRLGEGLKSLRSLQMLQNLAVPRDVIVGLRKRDLEWMTKMWPNLRSIYCSYAKRFHQFGVLCNKYGLGWQFDSPVCNFSNC